MKILHVITSLHTGGAERLMVDLLPRFRDMGHEVELCIFDGTRTPFYEALQLEGITIHSLMPNGGNVYNPLNIFRLKRVIRQGNYDIIHTHNTAAQLFGAMAVSRHKRKLVTTEHNTTNRRRGNPIFKIVDRWMYSRYHKIACISADTLSSLTTYLPVLQKTELIENGVDLSRFASSGKNCTTSPPFTITMTAAFRPQKDQDTLIKAATLLPDNYRFRLVGDGERREEMEAYAASLGVTDRVDFMGIRSDIPKILAESDIIVLSSHYEGLSLSSVEGMASGRPFIASDVPGLREVVGDAGILFPEGDAKALAQEIRNLCEDSDLYARTVAACLKRAAQYDIAKTAEEYNKLYMSYVNL